MSGSELSLGAIKTNTVTFEEEVTSVGETDVGTGTV